MYIYVGRLSPSFVFLKNLLVPRFSFFSRSKFLKIVQSSSGHSMDARPVVQTLDELLPVGRSGIASQRRCDPTENSAGDAGVQSSGRQGSKMQRRVAASSVKDVKKRGVENLQELRQAALEQLAVIEQAETRLRWLQEEARQREAEEENRRMDDRGLREESESPKTVDDGNPGRVPLSLVVQKLKEAEKLLGEILERGYK